MREREQFRVVWGAKGREQQRVYATEYSARRWLGDIRRSVRPGVYARLERRSLGPWRLHPSEMSEGEDR